MSTRSAIIAHDGEQYLGIYCHSDGYPAWLGTILQGCYKTHADALALIALGDLSCLDQDGTATAYHRDCGEDLVIRRGDTVQEVAAKIEHEYRYVFDKDKWRCGEYERSTRPLAEVLANPEVQGDVARMRLCYPNLGPPTARPASSTKPSSLNHD